MRGLQGTEAWVMGRSLRHALAWSLLVAAALGACSQSAAGVRDYDPEAVQPVGAKVEEAYVRRAVASALDIEGVGALAGDGHQFVVESVRLQPLFDEACLGEPGQTTGEDCEPAVESPEEMRALRDRDAHGGEVRLSLGSAVTPGDSLRVACPPLSVDATVQELLFQVIIYGAEDAGSDTAYVLSARTNGETVGCGPARTLDSSPTDPELEKPPEGL